MLIEHPIFQKFSIIFFTIETENETEISYTTTAVVYEISVSVCQLQDAQCINVIYMPKEYAPISMSKIYSCLFSHQKFV